MRKYEFVNTLATEKRMFLIFSKSLTLVLFLLINFLSFSRSELNIETSDSLILQKKSTDEFYYIRINQSLKVNHGYERTKGKLLSYENNHISISNEKDTVSIDLTEIDKIKVFRNNGARFTGYFLQVIGGLGISASAGIVGVSLWSLINEGELYIVYTLPAAIACVGIFKLGNLISGPSFKIGKKWKVVN